MRLEDYLVLTLTLTVSVLLISWLGGFERDHVVSDECPMVLELSGLTMMIDCCQK